MEHLLPVYKPSSISLTKGKGVWVFDADGKRYLDFSSGVAVSSLGHCHPQVVEALCNQAHEIWHTSNLYDIKKREEFAKQLCEASFGDVVFFSNSGTEAMECALKMARAHGKMQGGFPCSEMIVFEGAFHGRTLFPLSAGGDENKALPFAPLVPGFKRVPFGDVGAVEKALNEKTCAVVVEPIQGEGGVRVLPPSHLKALCDLAHAKGVLLVLDEVQTGMGRTGSLFAHEKANITPDIMALAKGLGAGFPMGATLATKKVASAMTQGSHGSTFGGNPLAMAVGQAVFDVLTQEGFLDHVAKMGVHLRHTLEEVASAFPHVLGAVRGEGLLMGVEIKKDLANFVEASRLQGLLCVPAGENVVRFLPPLIVEASHIDQAGTIMHHVCSTL